eukprot:maker-scaffold_14-snap-gene-1.3-mRNA-1 protein AED:0.01 eAED:0.01 QI:398/1/1/1/1/1/3/419/321
MFRSGSLLRSAGASKYGGIAVAGQFTRGLAVNPNDIAKRITSTQSIEKITKSMKTVSAVKLRADTKRLMEGRVFGSGFERILNPSLSEEEEKPEIKNPLYVMISSDKGLCGGVNGYVSKMVKASLDEDSKNDKNPKLMVLGEKGLAMVQRTHGDYIVGTIGEATKIPMNFFKCISIAERINAVIKANPEIDAIHIAYNRFKNSITYETEYKTVPVFSNLMDKTTPEDPDLPLPLNKYEIEFESPEEAVNNVFEYGLAVQLYSCIIESATSEQSSRMTAMDGASKNASEMVEKLTVQFNRARQAKITTELIEIISGAESLKG